LWPEEATFRRRRKKKLREGTAAAASDGAAGRHRKGLADPTERAHEAAAMQTLSHRADQALASRLAACWRLRREGGDTDVVLVADGDEEGDSRQIQAHQVSHFTNYF